jgi:hypothetical protein
MFWDLKLSKGRRVGHAGSGPQRPTYHGWPEHKFSLRHRPFFADTDSLVQVGCKLAVGYRIQLRLGGGEQGTSPVAEPEADADVKIRGENHTWVDYLCLVIALHIIQ